MSIDINTLRIGSHILCNGNRERVRGLEEDGGLIIRFPAEYVLASEVEPIRITEELLTELGFEKRESGSFAKGYAPDSWIFITLYATNELCKVNIFPSDPRKEASSVLGCYLHELELFLYLTTKTELIKE